MSSSLYGLLPHCGRQLGGEHEDEQDLQQPGRGAGGQGGEVELGGVEPGLVLGEAVPQRGHQRVQLPRLQLPGLLPQCRSSPADLWQKKSVAPTLAQSDQ